MASMSKRKQGRGKGFFSVTIQVFVKNLPLPGNVTAQECFILVLFEKVNMSEDVVLLKLHFFFHRSCLPAMVGYIIHG